MCRPKRIFQFLKPFDDSHNELKRHMMMTAALYVETDGPYFGIHGVDPWDEKRDARQYLGRIGSSRILPASAGDGSSMDRPASPTSSSLATMAAASPLH